jgi:hypothetical protein
VILFCVATGIVHGAVGITDHAMQSMAIRGFIAHNRESGAYMIGSIEGIGGAWKMPPADDTFDARYGRW